MIRPELRAAFWRWREALAGVAVALLGLYWVIVPGGLLFYLGFPVMLAGGALAVSGLQRARFRGSADGPGVVQIVEGRVGYFGPLTGGALDLADLDSLTLDHLANPPHWRLHIRDQPDLAIPVGAKGADALFDAFERLPGLHTERMLGALRSGTGVTVIWRSPQAQARVRRLH